MFPRDEFDPEGRESNDSNDDSTLGRSTGLTPATANPTSVRILTRTTSRETAHGICNPDTEPVWQE
jgi:hypothetical protein